MISPKLYKSGHTYDFFLKMLGFEGSIDRFLNHLEISCRSDCRILDAGCGTGILGLHFLERFPQSTLHATDIEAGFLAATLNNADRRGIDTSRITIAEGDISSPQLYKPASGDAQAFAPATFDIICIGAVVGYSSNTASSLRTLVRMLAPGGYFLNVEMNESLTGRVVSNRYQYDNISLDSMRDILCDEGCEIVQTPLKMRHLPAKLTRTAIIGRKRS